ncbi:MAG: glycosyltransferase family 4 protein [Kiritimatiellia bacterium]|jgi:glycosyltransferase involved in cell wall biosynthesis
MTIVLDMRWVGDPPSDVEVYARELARRIPLLAPSERFSLLFRDADLRDRTLSDLGIASLPNVRGVVFPYSPASFLGQFFLPIWLRVHHCDVFHSPGATLPYLAFNGLRRCSAGRAIATIHDADPLLVRNADGTGARAARRRAFRRATLRGTIDRSCVVLVPSETLRRDLASSLRLRGVALEKFHVIFHGADALGVGASSPPPGPSAPLVLYVGRCGPHKQVPDLVRAFKEVLHRGAANARLVIVGPEDPNHPAARRMAESLGIEDHVLFPGLLSPSNLSALYREAAVVVNPSRYEGSALPILEAMAHGAPVVCTDGGAQPEIAGDAARIVPAGDTSALAKSILSVLSDPALRRDLAARGLARAAQFTWDRTAAETLAAYRVVGRKDSTFRRIAMARQGGRP